MDCTPRVAELCFRLSILSSEVKEQLDKLNKRIGFNPETNLLQEPLLQSKKPLKKKHNKSKPWKIELKEIITTPIDAELLDEVR